MALVLTTLASEMSSIRAKLSRILEAGTEQLAGLALEFLSAEVTPARALDFEQQVDAACRDLARRLVEQVYNLIEPEDPQQMPHDVRFEAGGYRRLNRKTPNRHVATLFGTITLHRFGYRSWHRDEQEPTIFPLELQLGLVEGATPALAERAARFLAEAGATQQSVLGRLRCEHGVAWGVKRLRALAEGLSGAMEGFRRTFQVERLLGLLEQAWRSSGCRKPVLAVGRDGISLGTQPYGFFENGTTGTLTVYDRRGQRLGSVYLACAPQAGQATMTRELRALIEEVLRRWERPLPRLCYVTDAGHHETEFYRTVLRPMRDPRSGQRLEWSWIVDYYHASEKITTMAEALFGPGEQASAWATKMRKLLLKPNGPSRVLHSAAALEGRYGVARRQRQAFRQAYNYIRQRTRHMQYHAFRRDHLPIGSGVTEAACKTIFTQRLKLSGMRWKQPGAQIILNLRVILLSGIWDEAYRATVNDAASTVTTYGNSPHCCLEMAA